MNDFGHDPLCTMAHLPYDGRCWCPLIAKVRADERERIAQAIEEEAAEQRDFDPIYTDGLQDAARIARGRRRVTGR